MERALDDPERAFLTPIQLCLQHVSKSKPSISTVLPPNSSMLGNPVAAKPLGFSRFLPKLLNPVTTTL
jgi:hypothetical protein